MLDWRKNLYVVYHLTANLDVTNNDYESFCNTFSEIVGLIFFSWQSLAGKALLIVLKASDM